MRFVSYILLSLVMIFLTNVAAAFLFPSYRTILREAKTGIVGQHPESEDRALKQNEITQKILADSLDRIDKSILSLASNTGSIQMGMMTGSGQSVSGAIIPPSITPPVPIVDPDIAISGLFLAKIMPDITLKKTENR